MNEGFDADRDCVTGMEVPVKSILKIGLERPFDGSTLLDPLSPEEEKFHWPLAAAHGVMKDLSWRDTIGPVLKNCDQETRAALTRRVHDIVLSAARTYETGVRDFKKQAALQAEVDELRRDLEDARKVIGRGFIRAEALESHVDRISGHLRTLSGVLRYDYSGVSDADINAAKEDGWLLEDFGKRRVDPIADVRLLDLDETRARLSAIEAERDEAVARADVADYTREALVSRCKDLEAQLAVEGRVLGADVRVALDGKATVTVTVSEVLEPRFMDGRDNAVTVTTTGSDVTDVLERHEKAVAFYERVDESEAA